MISKNKFDTLFFTSTLQLLCKDCKTGILKAERTEEEVTLCLEKGNIVYVMSSSPKARLGSLLISSGIITPEQLKHSLQLSKDRKQSLGKILVRQKYISTEKLQLAIYLQAQYVIYNMFLWESGRFEYQDVSMDAAGIVKVNLHIINLLMNAPKNVDSLVKFKHNHLCGNPIFKQAASLPKPIRSAEANILRLINGTNTLHHILQQSDYYEFIVYKSLYSLYSKKSIQLA